jgi:hypothetical protein
MHHAVLSIPGSAPTERCCQSLAYPQAIIPMHVLSGFLYRARQCMVPMHQRSSDVALKLPGNEVCAECAKLSPVESQMKPIITLLERLFAAATFREQGNEDERENGDHDHRHLHAVHSLYDRQNIAEVTYTEDRRRESRSGNDECASDCEWCGPASRKPQQQRKDERVWIK